MNNFKPSGKQRNHFGNGDASRKIVKILDEYGSRNFSKL
jgi:hypothetical protein